MHGRGSFQQQLQDRPTASQTCQRRVKICSLLRVGCLHCMYSLFAANTSAVSTQPCIDSAALTNEQEPEIPLPTHSFSGIIFVMGAAQYTRFGSTIHVIYFYQEIMEDSLLFLSSSVTQCKCNLALAIFVQCTQDCNPNWCARYYCSVN